MQCAQDRVGQLDLALTLAAFASRSVTSTPLRFARDYDAHASLVICVETRRLRTSDGEHDQGVSRKPFSHAIRESRITSSPRDKMIDSTASRILTVRTARPTHRVPAFRFVRSSSFRHSTRPLCCPRRRFGTGPVLREICISEGFRDAGTRRAIFSRRHLEIGRRRLRSVEVCSSRVQESQSGDREDSLDRRGPDRK